MGEVPDREDEPDTGVDLEDDDADARDDDGDGGDDDHVERAEPQLPNIEPGALVEILEFLAKGLVENPDAVVVQLVEREGGVTLRLSVDQPDMGKVIGRAGRTARAIRTLMRAAGVRAGVSTHVEIVEE